MTQLLVVDDEPQFRNTLINALKRQGYRASGIADTDALTPTLAIQRPDVILLDLNFDSGTNGLEACERLRHWSSVPVMVISVSSDEATKVKALSVGADDFLVKPFGILELSARIEAIQRRLAPRGNAQTPVVQVQDLNINLHTHSVLLSGDALDLTRKEYKLLETLAIAQGELVTYQALVDRIWADENVDAEKSSAIRSLVKRLRQKLGEDLTRPNYILTQPGMGFRLNIRPRT
jgi:two-component system, OmpR family, KDP operon response regulator KdpE